MTKKLFYSCGYITAGAFYVLYIFKIYLRSVYYHANTLKMLNFGVCFLSLMQTLKFKFGHNNAIY